MNIHAAYRAIFNKVIETVEATNMCRWYDTEIISILQGICPERADVIQHFKSRTLWYKDEIVTYLKGLAV